MRHIFDAFARKEGFALRDCFAEDAVWHVPGESIVSGTYQGRTEIFRFLARLPKETNGTYGSRLIDVLASDDRAAALRNGRRKHRSPRPGCHARPQIVACPPHELLQPLPNHMRSFAR